METARRSHHRFETTHAVVVGAALACMLVSGIRGRAERPFTTALVTIPAGRFTMGSPVTEAERGRDESEHAVSLTHAFLLGAHEVTQEEWQGVMGTTPSHFARCPRCPVERINYFEIQEFIRRVNAAQADYVYRLPTEAEWEYACRAGSRTPFATGRNLTTSQANYNGMFPYAGSPPGVYRARTTPVSSFAPNAWGLYDMHGNVWEWTSDWYGAYPDGPQTDPHGPTTGEKRVIRGGSWYFDANSARCALRYTHAPKDRGFSLGFRVAADRRPRR